MMTLRKKLFGLMAPDQSLKISTCVTLLKFYPTDIKKFLMVVDVVGGKVKFSVHKKVMSIGKEKIIVQDAESFCKLAKELSKSTTVIYISDDDVEAYKRTDPFADSVPVPGISKMHVMISNCENTQLWLNSAQQKSDPPSITICNKSLN